MTLTHDDQPLLPHARAPRDAPLPGYPGHAGRPLRSGHPDGALRTSLGAPGAHRAPRRLAVLVRRVVLAGSGTVLLAATGALVVTLVAALPPGFTLGELGRTSGALAGVDGAYPGGPAEQVPVTVRNPQPTSLEIIAVRTELTGLPARCPASAWRTPPPEDLPTVAARAEATLTVPVSLAADAPAGCQTVTARIRVRIDAQQRPLPPSRPPEPPEPSGPSGPSVLAGPAEPSALGDAGPPRPVALSADAELTTATLGSPSARVEDWSGPLTVVPVPPSGGPAPAGYLVWAVGADGARTALCPVPVRACVDPGGAAADRRYLVSAVLGRWIRDSAPVPHPAGNGPAVPASPADPASPASPADPASPASPADPADPAVPALPSGGGPAAPTAVPAPAPSAGAGLEGLGGAPTVTPRSGTGPAATTPGRLTLALGPRAHGPRPTRRAPHRLRPGIEPPSGRTPTVTDPLVTGPTAGPVGPGTGPAGTGTTGTSPDGVQPVDPSVAVGGHR